jgi:hypothetical protein
MEETVKNKIMKTPENIAKELYRSKFWRTYTIALCISIIASLGIGLVTSSVWLGLLSYFAINILLSIGVLYKFSIDAENL